MHALDVVTRRVATVPVLLILLTAFIACIIFVLPRHQAATNVYTGSAGGLGVSFFLTPDSIYKKAEAYGDDGRRVYIKALLLYDFVWPLVYALFYLVCIRLSLGYAHGERTARLCCVALLPLLADWLENLLAIGILVRYPIRMDAVAWTLSGVTSIKWISMGCASALLIYGMLAAPVQFVRRRKKACNVDAG